ncbi:MAG TPA: SGNH hydrolase domain-containing protein, partial [Micromonospora sp.]
RVGAACTGVAAVAGLLFQLTVWPPPQAPVSTAAVPLPGAGVTASAAPAVAGATVLGPTPRGNPKGAPVDRVASIVPDPLAVRADLPDVYPHGCVTAYRDATVRSCVYGDRDGSYTVALVGDSHAANWLPALQEVATARRWRLVTYIRSSCPFFTGEVSVAGRTDDACTEWNTRVRSALTGSERPDLVVTSSLAYVPSRDGEPVDDDDIEDVFADGLRRAWSAVASKRTPVVVLRGIPVFPHNVAECVSQHPRRLTRCSVDRDRALRAGSGEVQERAARGLRDVELIDLNDAVCPTERCAPVIGGVLVYRDTMHLTATYARSMAPRLDRALGALLD